MHRLAFHSGNVHFAMLKLLNILDSYLPPLLIISRLLVSFTYSLVYGCLYIEVFSVVFKFFVLHSDYLLYFEWKTSLKVGYLTDIQSDRWLISEKSEGEHKTFIFYVTWRIYKKIWKGVGEINQYLRALTGFEEDHSWISTQMTAHISLYFQF